MEVSLLQAARRNTRSLPIHTFRDQMQELSFSPCSLGTISPCPLGTEKKFRLFLTFQRDGNPQKTAWLVSYSITWAGLQRFGVLLGTSIASSGARHRCSRLVPGWAVMSSCAVSCLGATQGDDCASKLPAACSALCWAQLRSSQFWSRVKGSSVLSGPHSVAHQGHASCLDLLHWQHNVPDLPEMLP